MPLTIAPRVSPRVSNELATRDVEGARKFYGTIMPWDFEMFSAGDDATPPEYWVIKLPTKVDRDGHADDEFNGGVIPGGIAVAMLEVSVDA